MLIFVKHIMQFEQLTECQTVQDFPYPEFCLLEHYNDSTTEQLLNT